MQDFIEIIYTAGLDKTCTPYYTKYSQSKIDCRYRKSPTCGSSGEFMQPRYISSLSKSVIKTFNF